MSGRQDGRFVDGSLHEEVEERVHVLGWHVCAHLLARVLVRLWLEVQLAPQHLAQDRDAFGRAQRFGTRDPIGATLGFVGEQRGARDSGDVARIVRGDGDVCERLPDRRARADLWKPAQRVGHEAVGTQERGGDSGLLQRLLGADVTRGDGVRQVAVGAALLDSSATRETSADFISRTSPASSYPLSCASG
jgi:hypothetical protein